MTKGFIKIICPQCKGGKSIKSCACCIGKGEVFKFAQEQAADTKDWENRAHALPFERRAAEMECTCGNTDVIRGKDFIRCLSCKTKTVFEPDDLPSPTDQATDILRELETRAETPCTHCAGSGVHEVTDSSCLECRGTGKQHVSGATYRQAIQEVLSLLEKAEAA